MALQTPIPLMGVPGSPYTRKMLAVLRYRHIPYRLLLASHRSPPEGMPRSKVPLLPTFYLPGVNGELEAVTDSTPIIRRLEEEFQDRSIIPSDPVIAFLDYLLEDYGDEWLTKAMFHYRWYYKADIDNAGNILPIWAGWPIRDAELAQMKTYISERQIGRLYVVGSNDTTAPVIEESYRRYLAIMERHFQTYKFTLGNRPSSADFGAYGQLTQLVRFDPTPMAVAQREAPRVSAWVDLVEDLSGIEPTEADWISRDAIPETLTALLTEVGDVYVPVMLANAQAQMAGAKEVKTEVGGKPWVQQPFPYQVKCLQWLRAEYGALSAADRAAVDSILKGTGCERLLA
jgi:glutathione S-transferase